MFQPVSPFRSLPAELPALAVLGLTTPANGDWAQLRGIQYATVTHAANSRLVTKIAAALATSLLLMAYVHWIAIAAWLALILVIQVRVWRNSRELARSDKRRLGTGDIRKAWTTAALSAMSWSVPLAIFAPVSEPEIAVKVWTVLAMLMTAVAVMLPAIPMATIIFSTIVGASSVALFLHTGSPDMAIIAALFCATVCFGAVEGARRYLSAKIAEAGIAERNEVVSMLLREFEEGDADWLWQTDIARRVRSVSPRFAFALGREPQSAEGQPLVQLIAGETWESGDFHSSLRELAERLKRKENFSNLLVRAVIGGEQRWWEISGTPRFDEANNFLGFRGVGSDVTEARENSDKIAYMARYDTLTGLPNRMLLTETLAGALEASERWRSRCAFLMIDLDRFKAVNDTLGHIVGDKLLARVSQRLRDELNDKALCGRLGGDEFAVVVQDVSDITEVEEIAQRIIARLSRPYEIDSHTLYVGASVGSAVGPRDGSTVEELMRNADLALYRSKDIGGNLHCTYEPELHANAEERRQLEVSMRHALERGEFELHYQPVVDTESEQVVSFEALMRWQSAEHGFVSPGKFIPLAEDTRLIVPIGEWALREACREAMNWPDHVRVAVNVSGEQLLQSSFAASVMSALAHAGLPAHRLEIEVTESIFLRDAALARSTLEQVMALGCSVALDDFGTGYSSLGYLRKLRFSTIKVDRMFVQGAATGNAESIAIIRAVVAMADSLGMSTTAEGVETEIELDMIRRFGCKKIQGFFFGRPMRAADARRLFRHVPRTVNAA